MKRLAEFALDGGSIFIEVDDFEQEGRSRERTLRGRGLQGNNEEGPQRFIDAVARIKPAAEAVLRTFQEMQTPQEISLEFGVKFTASAGAILASVDSEATFKVSLKWQKGDQTAS